MLPVAILAGGRATRLRPLTDRVPKSLLEVAGRPFIFHQLDLLRQQGIERVVLCVAHLGEQIRAAVNAAATPGLTVSYCFDGSEQLGSGGALKHALPQLGEEFFVLHGDSYLRCSLPEVQAAYRAARRPALMTVLRNDNRWDRSNVVFRDGELVRYDKRAQTPDMQYIDYGVAILRREALLRVPENEPYDLANLYSQLVAEGQMAGHEVTNRFYEIGTPAALEEARQYLEQKYRIIGRS